MDILLLLHGSRAVHGLVHVATEVQELVNCAVKARCQRIAAVFERAYTVYLFISKLQHDEQEAIKLYSSRRWWPLPENYAC